VLANLLFVVGCVMFFEVWPRWVYNTGLWFFFIGSVMNVGLSAYAIVEMKITNTQESDGVSKSPEKQERTESNDEFQLGARDELFEHTIYIGSGLAFAIGSVMWMPFWYRTSWSAVNGHAASAWCFIFGSLGLVLASIWNAFGLVEESAKRRTRLSSTSQNVEINCRRLASLALCCTAIGGALFVTGSFLFRPGFENDCAIETPLPEGASGEHDRGEPVSGSRFRKLSSVQDHGQLRLPTGAEEVIIMPGLDRGSSPTSDEDELGAAPLPPGGPMALMWSAGLAEQRRHGDHDQEARPHHDGHIRAFGPRGHGSTPQPVAFGRGDPRILFHNPMCVDIVRQGTWVYLWGCVAFLAQSIMSLVCSVVLQRYSAEKQSGIASQQSHQRNPPPIIHTGSLPFVPLGEETTSRVS
jgi:hypothetical protein